MTKEVNKDDDSILKPWASFLGRMRGIPEYLKKRCWFLLFITPFLYFFWMFITVDPEYACINPKNFDLCLDACFLYRDSFKKLPTDDQMVMHFNANRESFDKIKQMKLDVIKSRGNHLLIKKLEEFALPYAFSSSMFVAYSSVSPQDKPDTPRIVVARGGLTQAAQERFPEVEYALEFDVSMTQYINGGRKYWPHSIRTKGYIYFPFSPKVVNGYVLGGKWASREERGVKLANIGNETKGTKGSNEKWLKWRLFDNLDGHFPDDWKSSEYLLRKIDDNWFLFISKDVNGG